MRQAALRIALPIALILMVGCTSQPLQAPKTVPVSGKVLLPGGEALSGGLLTLKPKQPGAPEAFSEVERDGSFKLAGVGGGVVPGEYVVVIEPVTYKSGSAKRLTLPVPKKYSSDKTSDLVVKIEDGMQPLTIRMK